MTHQHRWRQEQNSQVFPVDCGTDKCKEAYMSFASQVKCPTLVDLTVLTRTNWALFCHESCAHLITKSEGSFRKIRKCSTSRIYSRKIQAEAWQINIQRCLEKTCFQKSISWLYLCRLMQYRFTSSSFRGGAIFMKFHSMTLLCLFNRGTNFSQTVTNTLRNISENENFSVLINMHTERSGQKKLVA